jgi:hypothetical protein
LAGGAAAASIMVTTSAIDQSVLETPAAVEGDISTAPSIPTKS